VNASHGNLSTPRIAQRVAVRGFPGWGLTDSCVNMTGPTAGIKSLRTAVANLYNAHHRKGKESQYTWENVCIVPGGRAGLIRIAAVINNAYLGFFIPDYTAYNEVCAFYAV